MSDDGASELAVEARMNPRAGFVTQATVMVGFPVNGRLIAGDSNSTGIEGPKRRLLHRPKQ